MKKVRKVRWHGAVRETYLYIEREREKGGGGGTEREKIVCVCVSVFVYPSVSVFEDARICMTSRGHF